MTQGLINHLWQSTVFALAVGLSTLAFRQSRAGIRYSLWLTASGKFLVPLTLLVSFGNLLHRQPPGLIVLSQPIPNAIVSFSEPFVPLPNTPFRQGKRIDWTTPALLIWLGGCATLVWLRYRAWLRIRSAIHVSTRDILSSCIEVRSGSASLEPGVVGWRRPIILIPAGIRRHLSASQLQAVTAHEVCHVQRRDNLTSTIQMIAETMFWFYPLVWWIGRRMIAERERAYDEEVLRLGYEPGEYAEAILAVCRWSAESSLACSPGIAGSDLRKRIERILEGDLSRNLNLARKVLLAFAGLAALAAPILVGIADAPGSLWAQAPPAFAPAGGNRPSFDVASVRADKSGAPPKSNFPLNAGGMYTPSGGLFSATGFPLVTYIAFAYDLVGNQLQVLVPQLPGWAMTDRFDIQARAAGNPTKDQMRLMMRSLLVDRFRFRIHAENRETSVLACVMAKPGKTGPQLQPHATDVPCPTEIEPTSGPNEVPGILLQKIPGGYPAVCNSILGLPPSAPGRSRLGGRNVTIAFMADMFSQRVNRGRPMIDATGLQGTFDFLLEFVPESKNATLSDAPPVPEPDGPSFDEALRDQLGIRMESRRAEMQMIVVDDVQRPSDN